MDSRITGLRCWSEVASSSAKTVLPAASGPSTQTRNTPAAVVPHRPSLTAARTWARSPVTCESYRAALSIGSDIAQRRIQRRRRVATHLHIADIFAAPARRELLAFDLLEAELA